MPTSETPTHPGSATRSSVRERTGLLAGLGLALFLGALPLPAQQGSSVAGLDPAAHQKRLAERSAEWGSRAGEKRRRDRYPKGAFGSGATSALGKPTANGLPAADCEWSDRYGFGGLDGPVFAQVTFDDGSGEALYVGGDIFTAAGLPVLGIAKWDGTAWSDLAGGMDDIVWALEVFDDGSGEALYAGGFFTTAGGVPAAGIAKWDGTSWSPLGAGVDDSVFALEVFDDGGGDALFVGGFFSTAGGAPASNIAKWDGTSWSALGPGVDEEVDALAVFDDGGGGGEALYVGGFFSMAGGGAASNIARWDGASWSPLGLGTSDGVAALEVFDDGGGDDLFAGGFFAAAGGGPVFGIAQWDGATWSDLDTGMSDPVLSLTTYDDGGGEALYAGGFFSEAGSVPTAALRVARWDGAAWSALGGGVGDVFFFDEVDSLAVFDDGSGDDLYAGGFFFEAGGEATPFQASWDGAAWSAVLASGPGFQGMDFVVYAFQVFDDGSGPALYAGGEFLLAGGVTVNGVARWDGSSWSPLGSGMACEAFEIPMLVAGGEPERSLAPRVIPVPEGCEFPSVEALAVFDDGSGPALVAGGLFDFAGGVPASNVAKWDGTSWFALDIGTDAIVEALEVFDDGTGPALVAGGEFASAGGVPVSNVARWDGAAWSALGLGVDDDVETLEVFDDGGGEDLYAGGEFLNAGGAPASFVARWDGAAWSPVGLGTDDEVEVLQVYDDGGGADLYAGGQFDSAGGLPAPSIARWDGTAWSTLGSGMASSFPFRTVDALAGFDDGGGTDLYAGGFFDFAGGVPALNMARWDGAAWSPVGAGTNDEVEALAVFNVTGPSLYAGGFFTEAGNLPSSYIGEWRCAPAELSIDDVTLAEGDAGTTDFVFTVTRSHNATDVSVDVASANGTALAGVDYDALPLQTVDFVQGGALSTTVTVQVLGDTVEEPPVLNFFVDLTNPVRATLADAQGIGTILDDDDDGPPSVVLVDSTAGTGDGELSECEEARVPVSRLHVRFDQAMSDPAGDADPGDVTNPGSYRLFAAGPDHDLQSSACGAPAGDDVAVSISAVTYDDGTLVATLELGTVLPDAPYRLLACGTLEDPAGNGLAGGDFARTFRVEQENLFQNGKLDCDLGGWSASSAAPGEFAHAADDVDSASISGSAALENLTASSRLSLSQCLPVEGGAAYLLSGALRLTADPATSLFFTRSCDLFASGDCSGSSLQSGLDVLQVGDTGGAWERVESRIETPPQATSASCSFVLGAPGGAGFSARLDDLELRRTDALIFADGFESGDVSAWSGAAP